MRFPIPLILFNLGCIRKVEVGHKHYINIQINQLTDFAYVTDGAEL
jgi:hypothetical protein